MTRYNNVDGVRVAFTPEEETARDAEEAAWEDSAVDRAWDALRRERNSKLDNTDKTQMSDRPNEGKLAWADYRQALRDLPTNTPDPANPTWPTSPE